MGMSAILIVILTLILLNEQVLVELIVRSFCINDIDFQTVTVFDNKTTDLY